MEETLSELKQRHCALRQERDSLKGMPDSRDRVQTIEVELREVGMEIRRIKMLDPEYDPSRSRKFVSSNSMDWELPTRATEVLTQILNEQGDPKVRGYIMKRYCRFATYAAIIASARKGDIRQTLALLQLAFHSSLNLPIYRRDIDLGAKLERLFNSAITALYRERVKEIQGKPLKTGRVKHSNFIPSPKRSVEEQTIRILSSRPVGEVIDFKEPDGTTGYIRIRKNPPGEPAKNQKIVQCGQLGHYALVTYDLPPTV